MTAQCTTLPTNSRNPSRPWALRFLKRLLAANALHRQQQALLRLDDHMLSDIGLTRSEAQTEANRPVWDAPTHWRGK